MDDDIDKVAQFVHESKKSLINQRSADAGVSLRFSVEGEVWEAAWSPASPAMTPSLIPCLSRE